MSRTKLTARQVQGLARCRQSTPLDRLNQPIAFDLVMKTCAEVNVVVEPRKLEASPPRSVLR
jgi:hypothetical protein